MHKHIAGSQLVECEGAGHMVILERHEQVNAALDQLIAAAAAHAPAPWRTSDASRSGSSTRRPPPTCSR